MVKLFSDQLIFLYRIAFLQRVIRRIVRFTWLGLLGYALIWTLEYLFPHLPLAEFRWLGFLCFGIWALYGIFFPRFSLQQFVWRVDCIQGLKAQLATAFQYQSGEKNEVIATLSEEVNAKLPEIKSRILREGWSVMPEIEYLILALCLLIVLSVVSVPNMVIAQDYGVDIPPILAEKRQEDVFEDGIFGVKNYMEDMNTAEQADGKQSQNQGLSDNETVMQAIQELGKNLRESPLTQGLGEALEKGDLEKGAQILESIAEQIGELPVPIQQEISNLLSQSADKLDQRKASDLSNQLKSAANSLQKGDAQSGSQGLRQISESLMKIAQQSDSPGTDEDPNSQSSLGGGGGSSQGNVELGSPLSLDRLQGESESLAFQATEPSEVAIFVPGLAEVAGESQTYSGQYNFFSTSTAQTGQGQIVPLPIIWRWLNEIKFYFLP